MKREFKVGDKVCWDVHWSGAVYSTHGNMNAFLESEQVLKKWTGEIMAIKSGLAQIRSSHQTVYVQPLRNLRHLKPKPTIQKREARRGWVAIEVFDKLDMDGIYIQRQKPSTGYTWTEFREILPGEIVVDRGKLEKAWDENVARSAGWWPAKSSSGFRDFCKTIGLLEVGK